MRPPDGRIAASANAEIQQYIVTERTAIQQNVQDLQKAITTVNEYTSGQSKQKETDVLNAATTVVMRSSDRLRILDKKTEVIVDFLGNETFSKSEIKTLFAPGDFTLNTSQMKEGQQRFRPIVEKLFTFADKYKDGFRKLRGEIIITGYSDATPVEPGSRLYQELTERVSLEDKISTPTSSDLNKKLSELRAGTIKKLLETIIQTRRQSQNSLSDIKISVSGRGEELPKGTSALLAKNDPNRRVVTFYWVVLPEL